MRKVNAWDQQPMAHAPAAGADIKEMSSRKFIDVYKHNMFAQWANLMQIKKPVSPMSISLIPQEVIIKNHLPCRSLQQ